MEAVTANERHKKRGRKDGDKITGDGNRLFGFDHIVPGCAAWLECDGNPYRDLSSIGAWTCSERTAFTDTRLRRFNIRRRMGTSRARNIWRGYRGHAFPWSDGLDYYSDPGQRALDFLLHPANFGT